MVQPLAHGLHEVVTGVVEQCIAAGEKFVLLALQRAAISRACGGRVADHFGAGDIDLAVEIGQLGIGADRLLNRPPRGRAIESEPLKRFRAKHALGLDPGVGTGSREENASNEKTRASVPIQSERKRLLERDPEKQPRARCGIAIG